MMLSTWVGVAEAAKLLQLSEHAIRDQVAKKIIPAMIKGKKQIQIARADIERIKANGLGAAGAPVFDAKAVAWELRIMELESRIERDKAELAKLRKSS